MKFAQLCECGARCWLPSVSHTQTHSHTHARTLTRLCNSWTKFRMRSSSIKCWQWNSCSIDANQTISMLLYNRLVHIHRSYYSNLFSWIDLLNFWTFVFSSIFVLFFSFGFYLLTLKNTFCLRLNTISFLAHFTHVNGFFSRSFFSSIFFFFFSKV